MIVINHATKSKNRCTGWNKKKGKVQHYAEEENIHSEQRKNRALVWHDLFGDKPYRSGVRHKAQGARKRSTFTK